MKMESSPVSIDLKTAAFKALLQGPLIFTQLSSRLGVSGQDMQTWLDEARANLCLIDEGAHPGACFGKMRRKGPLVDDAERKLLLG